MTEPDHPSSASPFTDCCPLVLCCKRSVCVCVQLRLEGHRGQLWFQQPELQWHSPAEALLARLFHENTRPKRRIFTMTRVSARAMADAPHPTLGWRKNLSAPSSLPRFLLASTRATQHANCSKASVLGGPCLLPRRSSTATTRVCGHVAQSLINIKAPPPPLTFTTKVSTGRRGNLL